MTDTLKATLRLLPTARALIALAQNDAPNYRAASEQARCANCASFDGSACRAYDFATDTDYICDSYDGRDPMQELKAFVEKYGARNSRMDQGTIQAAHDLMVKLGAMCGDLESKSALVWRHPGHPNQKVHGNRYGSTKGAKESLRRLKDDKEAREKYKAKARERGKQGKESGGIKRKLGRADLPPDEKAVLDTVANSYKKDSSGRQFMTGPSTEILQQGGYRWSTSERDTARAYAGAVEKKLLTEHKITSSSSNYKITDLGRELAKNDG